MQRQLHDHMTSGPAGDDGEVQCLMRLSPLVQALTASWTRRGHTLLEIGCGSGAALELLWTQGFDVTGLDRDHLLLRRAEERFQGRIEFRLGPYDDLPFEDQSFDYVVLMTVLQTGSPRDARRRFRFGSESRSEPDAGPGPESCSAGNQPDLETLLAEAGRLAAKGVLLVFPSSWSAAWLAARCGRGCRPFPAHSPLRLIRLTRKSFAGKRWTLRSLFPGPPSTWEARSGLWKYANDRLIPGPFGAFAGLRIDMHPAVPLTGLPLRMQDASLSLAPSEPLAHRTASPARARQNRQS